MVGGASAYPSAGIVYTVECLVESENAVVCSAIRNALATEHLYSINAGLTR